MVSSDRCVLVIDDRLEEIYQRAGYKPQTEPEFKGSLRSISDSSTIRELRDKVAVNLPQRLPLATASGSRHMIGELILNRRAFSAERWAGIFFLGLDSELDVKIVRAMKGKPRELELDLGEVPERFG